MPSRSEKANNPHLPELISGPELAKLVGVTDRQLRNLATEGVIPKPERRKYELRASVLAIIDRARSQAASAADEQRIAFMQAKREALELQTAEKRREVIHIDEHHAVLDLIVAKVREEVIGLPARVTRDMDLRRKLETEAHATLNRLSKSLDDAAEAIRRGDKTLDDLLGEEAA